MKVKTLSGPDKDCRRAWACAALNDYSQHSRLARQATVRRCRCIVRSRCVEMPKFVKAYKKLGGWRDNPSIRPMNENHERKDQKALPIERR